MSRGLAKLLGLLCVVCAAGSLWAGEAEVATLVSAEYFAVGGVGFGNTTSAGELAFQKIYAEKNNLEQFIVAYGKGGNAARMYALVAFHRLNRPLYDHLKAAHAESEAPVGRIMGCEAFTENLGQLIAQLEKGGFDALFPKPPAAAK